MVAEYRVEFPDYLDGYELETESKGYLTDVHVIDEIGQVYDLTVYDPARLIQEVDDEITATGSFAVANLLVVAKVNRESISTAVARLALSNFGDLLARTAGN